ncbi:MAG: molybdopterin-dependent oxidoreductase [Micromonosporaceae bacterium]
MTDTAALPPGQRAAEWRPFGLPRFAGRRTAPPDRPVLSVSGDVRRPTQLELASLAYPLKTQRSDLHCVTTWTARDIAWGGYLFRDVHEQLTALVEPRRPRWLVLRGMDGFRSCLRLDDALADDVLLVVRLDGASLPVERGGPVRLVAPAHYGYKSVKHLYAIEYHRDYRPGSAGWTEHPRGRVAHEERSRYLPGWIWRPLWRATVPRVTAIWERAGAARARR